MRSIKKMMAVLLVLVMFFSMVPMASMAKTFEDTDKSLELQEVTTVGHENQVRVIVENSTYAKADGAPWDGVLVDKWVDIDQSSSMGTAVKTAIESSGFTQTGAESNYISDVNGLGEFTGGQESGWMVTLNDWFINEGVGGFTVAKGNFEAGDEIWLLYTMAYGADLGGTWSNNDKTVKVIESNSGTLTPAFSSATKAYTLNVPKGTKELMITPTATNKNFQVRTSVGTTEYKRTAPIAVENGTVITVKCGDPSWLAMNDAGSIPAEVYTLTVKIEGSEEETPGLMYRTQVQNVGWQEWKNDGEMSGTEGRSLRLEGIEVKRNDNADVDLGIRYKTQIENIGWEDTWKADGVMSGTEGRSLRLEAIRIELTGEDAANYDVYYRVHAQNYGWLDWAKNGASAGTEGFGFRLEGIEITLVEKGNDAPGETERPFVTGNIHINYQTQIQNIGWQVLRTDGMMSGTKGRSLRLEGIKIKLDNAGYDVGVSYQTHVQDIGWQNLRTNGNMSGTEGESKRLEGIRINLTGADSELCDVYYQVHTQNIGWMNWAKNGESSGSEGFGYRLEGIRVVVIPKGSPVPQIESETSDKAFISNN